MQILAMRTFSGPNLYRYRPVLKVRLDIGQYEDIPSNQLEGFTDQLVALLPGLATHHCSLGRPGGFVERLREGTYLAHIFEHVAIEFQCLSGCEINFGKTRQAGAAGVYDVIIGCEAAAVAEQAVYAAQALLAAVLNKEVFSTDIWLTKIREAAARSTLGPSTGAIYQAALTRGIPIRRWEGQDLLVMGYGSRQKRVWATISSQTNAVAVDLASDKYLTNRVLADNGLPVAQGMVVDTATAAVQAARSIGCAVVVKPLAGNQGKGVTLDIQAAADVERAFAAAAAYGPEVLVEEYIRGRQYRLCVVAGRMVAASERIPAYVVGDGSRNILQLVEATNADPKRGDGHDRPLSKIKLDAVALEVLAKQNLTVHSVPPAKQIVFIRENSNLSTGGTAVDVTDIIHPENARIAERAAALIGLDIAGIDMVAEDITAPLKLGNGVIIEVNAAPGIRMHHYPSAGKMRDVGGAIVESLFPTGNDGRIPIVAITGTNGKTTVTRMIGYMFHLAGYRVGMATTDGIYVNGQCVLSGDTTGPDSARLVLADPGVDAAILETARGGVLRGGLGYDLCDVGVITNITEDHLGQDGVENLTDLAYIKSLVLETVRPGGHALINADDPGIMMLIQRARGEKVLFSIESSNILVRRHLGTGGKAVFVKDGILYAACGTEATAIAQVGEIAVTLGGIATHNLQNAAIAAAACYCVGLPLDYIRKGLADFAENPGRLTIIPVGDFQVCVDYGHNPAGYQALLSTVRRLQVKRIIGVIAAPGDRRDDVTINIGRIAGKGLDWIYIKEDSDLRGRKIGEVAGLLERGALEAGFAADKIMVVFDEVQAVQLAMAQAQPGDLVVVFYEKYELVLQAIDNFKKALLLQAEQERAILSEPKLVFVGSGV